MDSGDSSTGRPNSVLPNTTNPGLFLLDNGSSTITSSNNICKIVAITITSATYDPATTTIKYNPVPVPPLTGCSSDCEAAVRARLPIGATFNNIKAGNKVIATGSVIDSQYGITVFKSGNNITFANNCKIEIIN
jgi:hypothetical protein